MSESKEDIEKKEARRQYYRDYYKSHKDQIMASNKKWAEKNREQIRSSNKLAMKRYYAKNKNKLNDYKRNVYQTNHNNTKEKARAYYLANRERIKLKKKAYYEENKEEILKAYQDKRDGIVKSVKPKFIKPSPIKKTVKTFSPIKNCPQIIKFI